MKYFGDLQPKEIQDIVFRMKDYLVEMRKMENDGTVAFVQYLKSYIQGYFSAENDETRLRVLAVQCTNGLYLQVASLEIWDIHTAGYLGIVLYELFWGLSQKGSLCFFILDNEIRDDRFKFTVDAFRSAGFATIYPYDVNVADLRYTDAYTRLPVKDYKVVEKEIDAARARKRHLLYVEKDRSVNYIKDVLYLAEEFQSEYVCVFRNKSPLEHPQATSLVGDFGMALKD